jgi:hypothetical protein
MYIHEEKTINVVYTNGLFSLGVSSSILFTGGIFQNNAFVIFRFYGTKAKFKLLFLGGRKRKKRRKEGFITHIRKITI